MPQTKIPAHETPQHEGFETPRPISVHAHVYEHEAHHNHEDDECHEHGHIEPFDLVRIAITAIAACLVWLRAWEPFPHASLIGIAGVLFGGWPIFREAFDNLRERRMTMELSMT